MAGVTIRARSCAGPIIRDLAAWERYASTQGKWADDFSAKELARLWVSGQGSTPVVQALAPIMPNLSIEHAIAEAQIRFDRYDGGVRNHDVLLYGTARADTVVIGVEGKVNESLDGRLAAKYAAAERRKRKGLNSNLDKRVDDLLAAVLGKRYDDDPALANLRYQLFSAIAGTVAAAKPTTTAAAVIIHLIDTPQAQPKKFAETRAAVADFAQAAGLAAGPLVGPLRLKRPIKNAPDGLPIYLAVVETSSASN